MKNKKSNLTCSRFITGLFCFLALAFISVSPVMAWGDGFTITLNVLGGDTIAPQAVTDLTASTTATPGEVELTWTAPHENGTEGGKVNRFEIKYATFSITNLENNTTDWWNNATGSEGFDSVKEPGETETKPIDMPVLGTTYYFAIKSYDNVPLTSLIDVNAATPGQQAVCFVPLFPPSAPANFSGVAQSTKLIKWLWEDVANETEYRIRNDTGGLIYNTLSADVTYWLETNLSANTSYYRYAKSYNASGSSASASDVKFTLANPPSGSYFTGVSSESLTIAWSENGNPSHTRWEILRSTDDFISTTTLTNFTSNYTNISYTDSGLTSAVTYWYKVRAFNGDERESEYDITISTLTEQLTQTYKISGYVKDFRSKGLALVTVALSGYSSTSTVTGEDGYFEFASLPAEQDYTVSPATAVINGKLYSFLPVSRSTICLSADITDWEFRGEPAHVEGKPLAPVFICPPHNFLSFGSEVEKITIYSPGGRKVLDISGCVWYGTDNNSIPSSASGMIESGPYIYKVKTNSGKTRHGTVIIVK